MKKLDVLKWHSLVIEGWEYLCDIAKTSDVNVDRIRDLDRSLQTLSALVIAENK